MVNLEIVNYISSNLRRGIPYNEINAQLLIQGFSDFEISEAVEHMNKNVISKPEEISSNTTVHLKWFFIGFFGLIILIGLFLLFSFFFKDIGEKSILIKSESLNGGVFVEFAKTNLLKIEFMGGIIQFNVKDEGGILTFFNPEISFSLMEGDIQEVDLNLDGLIDLTINFSSAEKRTVFIKAVCHEEWECSEWSICINSKQKRVCTDINSCGTEINKPLFEIECVVESLTNYSI